MKPSILLPLVALSLFAFAAPARAQDDSGHFVFTPYIWMPTVKADTRFNIPPGTNTSPDIDIGPVDYLDSLSGIIMLNGEMRFDRFGAYADFIYLDFDNEEGSVRSLTGPGGTVFPIDVGTTSGMTAWMATLAGGYDFVQSPNLRLQAFAGLRYLDADAGAHIELSGPVGAFPQSISVARDEQLWDGIVGVRGEGRAGQWIFPYYLDVGAGSSELTWQASLGVGYRFGWGDLRLDYRYLSYEQGDDDDFIQNLSLSGPALGASFRF